MPLSSPVRLVFTRNLLQPQGQGTHERTRSGAGSTTGTGRYRACQSAPSELQTRQRFLYQAGRPQYDPFSSAEAVDQPIMMHDGQCRRVQALVPINFGSPCTPEEHESCYESIGLQGVLYVYPVPAPWVSRAKIVLGILVPIRLNSVVSTRSCGRRYDLPRFNVHERCHLQCPPPFEPPH